jgi:hypothetical protein
VIALPLIALWRNHRPMIIDDVSTWPAEVIEFLEKRHDLFLGWEQSRAGQPAIATVSGRAYDRAISDLRALLCPHALRGYHCTRLTVAEIDRVISTGMQLPNADMLGHRIQALYDAGLIDRRIADRLRRENLAGDTNRAGKIWFCFFAPRLAGRSGIERFFRYWGGEALYACHECDDETGAALRGIGTPCIIEANVSITALEVHSFLDIKVARRFLVDRGHETVEPLDHEDRAKQPISASNIRRILQHPEPKFLNLTACASWSPPLA